MALASLSGYDKLYTNDDYSRPSASRLTVDGIHNMNFELPVKETPKAFVDKYFGAKSSQQRCHMKFMKGTTTLAFTYEGKTDKDKGGIIVAVDSRASSGKYVSSSTVMKILPINDYMVATMAGGAADCQFWIRVLAKQAKLFELENKEAISVAAASKSLINMLYGYKGYGLSVGSMIAGFDKTGPSIYYVDSDGDRMRGNSFSVGSGCLTAYGVLDNFVKEKMTDQEAFDVGRRAIVYATHRDTGSGGRVTVCHVAPTGHYFESQDDVSEMYYKYMAESGRSIFDPKDLE